MFSNLSLFLKLLLYIYFKYQFKTTPSFQKTSPKLFNNFNASPRFLHKNIDKILISFSAGDMDFDKWVFYGSLCYFSYYLPIY